MGETVLSVKNLVTKFRTTEGTVTAVNDVSFDIERGKILGIVGESGCGKSVTSLSIMRLIDKKNGIIAGGSIMYGGRDILKVSDREMRRLRGNEISMIFQEPMTALNPVFTIGYQIGEVLTLHEGLKGRENKNKCVELLQIVGIPRPEKVVDEYPHQLSGGMRQRVMIAMALACNPKLLIADEPTTALDVTIQAQVLELMKALIKKYEMAIIFITHDLGVIAEMADEVAVMYAGKIVEQAKVNDIFASPVHPYTVGLMNSRPALAKKGDKLRCIDGMVPGLADMPAGCSFAPRCAYQSEVCAVQMPELSSRGHKHLIRCFNRQEVQ